MNPIIAIIGSKGCGKTTLRKTLSKQHPEFTFREIPLSREVPKCAKGVIALYTIAGYESYANAYSVIANLGERGRLIPTLLVGNKIDLGVRKIPQSRLVEECVQLIEEVPYLLAHPSSAFHPKKILAIRGDGIRSVHPLEISAKLGSYVSKIGDFFVSEVTNRLRYEDLSPIEGYTPYVHTVCTSEEDSVSEEDASEDVSFLDEE